jgi:hypothetical protein
MAATQHTTKSRAKVRSLASSSGRERAVVADVMCSEEEKAQQAAQNAQKAKERDGQKVVERQKELARQEEPARQNEPQRPIEGTGRR